MIIKLLALGAIVSVMTLVMAQSRTALSNSASFNEVWAVVTQNPPTPTEDMQNDIALYGNAGDPQLPSYSGMMSVLGSMINGSMKAAAIRTVESHEDYHYYFSKLVHANGTCFAGRWESTKESIYSGLFQKGHSGFIIGRISTATPQTTSDKDRAFGFAGKLFATANLDEVVQTANFFTVDNLNGTAAKHALDEAFTNEPPVNLSGFLNPLKMMNDIFAKADIHPTFRPLYPIARAGLGAGDAPVTPKWMRLRVAPGVKLETLNDADFRAELAPKNYPQGLVFTIEVSDTTKDATSDAGWTAIGQIRTSALVTTFGCDRRLHFNHPTYVDRGA